MSSDIYERLDPPQRRVADAVEAELVALMEAGVSLDDVTLHRYDDRTEIIVNGDRSIIKRVVVHPVER